MIEIVVKYEHIEQLMICFRLREIVNDKFIILLDFV